MALSRLARDQPYFKAPFDGPCLKDYFHAWRRKHEILISPISAPSGAQIRRCSKETPLLRGGNFSPALCRTEGTKKQIAGPSWLRSPITDAERIMLWSHRLLHGRILGEYEALCDSRNSCSELGKWNKPTGRRRRGIRGVI
jgi:hypothetical protein